MFLIQLMTGSLDNPITHRQDLQLSHFIRAKSKHLHVINGLHGHLSCLASPFQGETRDLRCFLPTMMDTMQTDTAYRDAVQIFQVVCNLN